MRALVAIDNTNAGGNGRDLRRSEQQLLATASLVRMSACFNYGGCADLSQHSSLRALCGANGGAFLLLS
jgi:hypothetical protein